MWGDTPLQRMRLGPLYAALRAGDLLSRLVPGSRAERAAAWQPGISIVVPDRDAPEMLAEALSAASLALERVPEPGQIVVVVNGAPLDRYDAVRSAFPAAELVHSARPLGFSAAIARGLARVRHDWTLLLNNDMRLDAGAIAELAAHRAPDVFSLTAQIFQRSADGRREETGFTDWYADGSGVHVYHAPVPGGRVPRPHLAGSGGATLFRTAPLARYVAQSRVYDPFYWEDIEWGVRAWRDGLRVLFCPAAHAHHRHRATTARFYAPGELERIVARNALLFDARNRTTPFGVDWLMGRICDQPRASQRELARARVARTVLARRAASPAGSPPPAPPVLADPARPVCEIPAASYSYRLRASDEGGRPVVLVVTPFAVYPPRHGGARRIAGLLGHLRRDCDVVLVTDEATLYGAHSFAFFDGLRAVYLVQRGKASAAAGADTLEARMASHAHPALLDAVAQARARHRPAIVQVEHAELAELVRPRGADERWVLDLHDAYGPADFASPAAAQRFQSELVAAYDAVVVCSDEDRALIAHPRVVSVPNGSSIEPGRYAPSASTRLLFMGPFRFAQNLAGIRRFLLEAFPAIRQAVPDAQILVLGGDEAARIAAGDAAFAQPGVEVAGHRDDVRALLDASALTVNPITGIRGSSIKVIESLCAGRVCVSTAEGARGFASAGLAGLIVAAEVAAMAEPIVRLLRDDDLRHRIEQPDAARLAPYRWAHAAGLLQSLYRDLAGGDR